MLLFPSKNCLFRQFFEKFASNISQISQNVTDNVEILRQFILIFTIFDVNFDLFSISLLFRLLNSKFCRLRRSRDYYLMANN